jgi:hypothetical protein
MKYYLNLSTKRFIIIFFIIFFIVLKAATITERKLLINDNYLISPLSLSLSKYIRYFFKITNYRIRSTSQREYSSPIIVVIALIFFVEVVYEPIFYSILLDL